MVISGTECTLYSNISASAATIVASGLIPIVQERITMMVNNYFLTDLNLTDSMTFNTSARTIIAAGNSFVDRNFAAGDDIFIYNSYRNGGYFTLETVSDKTLTLIPGQIVTDELSSRSILISVVKWPTPIKYIAAKMVAYDYDLRDSTPVNLKSYSLGPASKTFTDGEKDEFGYPKKLTEGLSDYRIARCF